MRTFAGIKAFFLVLVVLVAFPQLVSVVRASLTSDQGFITTNGDQIQYGGKEIILRGINYYGYECGNMENELHTEADYQRFAALGFNVVRLPVAWMWFEPEQGAFDKSYLQIVNKDVQWAKEYGLYIILDMHQWDWAHKFTDPSDGSKGCGAPNWSVAQYPSTEQGMDMAQANFWLNASLQDHLASVWENIAQFYANETTIAGYDLFNEPRVYTGVIPGLNSTVVDSFYLRVIRDIRSVDTNHILFLEPSNLPYTNFPIKEKIVWSPHFYPLAFCATYSPQNATLLKADLQAEYQQYVMIDSPMWIGEFGAFMTDNSYLNWLHDAINLFNQYHVGYAWWPFAGGPDPTIPDPVAAETVIPAPEFQVSPLLMVMVLIIPLILMTSRRPASRRSRRHSRARGSIRLFESANDSMRRLQLLFT